MNDRIDEKTIAARRDGRELAKWLVQSLIEEGLPAEGVESAWRYLRDESVKVVGAPPVEAASERPFTDAEADRFGANETMRYTRYFGQKVGEVPLGFLWHIVDKQARFILSLRRYLLAPKIKRRFEQEPDYEWRTDD